MANSPHTAEGDHVRERERLELLSLLLAGVVLMCLV